MAIFYRKYYFSKEWKGEEERLCTFPATRAAAGVAGSALRAPSWGAPGTCPAPPWATWTPARTQSGPAASGTRRRLLSERVNKWIPPHTYKSCFDHKIDINRLYSHLSRGLCKRFTDHWQLLCDVWPLARLRLYTCSKQPIYYQLYIIWVWVICIPLFWAFGIFVFNADKFNIQADFAIRISPPKNISSYRKGRGYDNLCMKIVKDTTERISELSETVTWYQGYRYGQLQLPDDSRTETKCFKGKDFKKGGRFGYVRVLFKRYITERAFQQASNLKSIQLMMNHSKLMMVVKCQISPMQCIHNVKNGSSLCVSRQSLELGMENETLLNPDRIDNSTLQVASAMFIYLTNCPIVQTQTNIEQIKKFFNKLDSH